MNWSLKLLAVWRLGRLFQFVVLVGFLLMLFDFGLFGDFLFRFSLFAFWGGFFFVTSTLTSASKAATLRLGFGCSL